MKLQRATFLGVRGVPDMTLDLTDPETGEPHDLVFVTGPTASGKTRILEAIAAAKEAIAPYSAPVRGERWVGDGEAAKVILAIRLDTEEQQLAGTTREVLEGEAKFTSRATDAAAQKGLFAVLGRYTHAGRCGKVEYFPALRSIPREELQRPDLAAHRAERCTAGPYKYGFVRHLLSELPSNREAATEFAARLSGLSATCRYDVELGKLRRDDGSRAGIDELSESERDAIVFAATATEIDLHCSIALVDRPDRVVPPDRASWFLDGLRALGQDNQWIMAPASGAFVDAAAGAKTFRLGEG